jgi:hypothetical protein
LVFVVGLFRIAKGASSWPLHIRPYKAILAVCEKASLFCCTHKRLACSVGLLRRNPKRGEFGL